MKKNFIIMLIIAMLSVLITNVSASDSQTKVFECSSTIKIEGETSPNTDITLLLLNKGTNRAEIKGSDIKHINQVKSDKEGTFSLTFKYEGDVANLELGVLENGECVDKPIVRKALSEVFHVSAKTIQNGKKLTVFADEFNELNIDNLDYDVVVAFYDKDNIMVGVNMVNNDQLKNNGSVNIDVPVNAKYRKVFALASTTIPLANVKMQENLNPIFNNVDKDEITVALIGDSLTQHNRWLGSYKQVLEHFYLTRYPDKNINFVNKGIGGGTATNALIGFDDDIMDCDGKKPDIAIVMYGMNNTTNIAKISDYNTAVKSINTNLDTFKKQMTKLLDKLRDAGVVPVVMSSTIYDVNVEGIEDPAENTYGNTYLERNMQLQEQAKFLKEYCTKNNILYIPMNEITTQLTEEIREANNSEDMEVFTRSDGIHPSPNSPGAYLLGAIVAYEQTQNSCVASVTIDASTGKYIADNAEISDVVATNSEVQYTYSPKSLPLAANAQYNEIESNFKYDITSKLNNETIVINNLSSGTYKLTIDGNELGRYTEEALSNGVNIATNPANPSQVISQRSFDILYDMNNKSDSNVREYWKKRIAIMGAGVNPDDDVAVKAHYGADQEGYDSYVKLKNEYPEKLSYVQEKFEDARKLCEPNTYTVKLELVSE